MKKSLIMVFVLLFISTSLFAGHKIDSQYMYESYAKTIYSKDISSDTEDMVYLNFVKEAIPSKFVTPFYNFTKDKKNIGIEILGIAKHESNWKWFIGKRNANGSIDLGPLMLNSFNIENESFMNSFANNCKQYEYDTDIYFMCICINYYKSLRCEYGPYSALQIYNGGWRTVRKNCPPSLKKTVTIYADTVYKYINRYSENYKSFKEINYDEYENKVVNHYTRKCEIESIEKVNEIFYISCLYSSGKNYKNLDDLLNKTKILYPYIYDKKFYDLYVMMSWNEVAFIYTILNIKFNEEEYDEEDDLVILNA